jgi:hypothetical protein
MGTPPLEAREVSGFLLRAVLRYVERAAGADAVRAIAERSGIDDAEAVMRYTGRWYSIAQTLRVANEAARVCGDGAIGRRTGEEACEERGFCDFVVALGTVPAAMELVLQRAQRMSEGRQFTIVEERDGRLLVTARPSPAPFPDVLLRVRPGCPGFRPTDLGVLRPSCRATVPGTRRRPLPVRADLGSGSPPGTSRPRSHRQRVGGRGAAVLSGGGPQPGRRTPAISRRRDPSQSDLRRSDRIARCATVSC